MTSSGAKIASAKAAADEGWLDRWGKRSTPQFAQFITWLLLGIALFMVCLSPEIVDPAEWPRQGPSTALSWLPKNMLDWPSLYWLLRGVLVVGAALWFWQRFLPWSCWLTVLGFTALWSLHVENCWHTNHCFHLANNLLIIQAIWMTSCAAEIQAAIRERRYWTTPLVPAWVTLAAVAYIGIFHTAAGLSKLSFSGLGWANGTSLQLWTHLWGRPWSPTTQMILGSRTFTQGLQMLTLVVETGGVLAIFPRLRTWIGLATVGFYLGVIATFDFGFQFNLLFTALYLLPVEAWILARAQAQRPSDESPAVSK